MTTFTSFAKLHISWMINSQLEQYSHAAYQLTGNTNAGQVSQMRLEQLLCHRNSLASAAMVSNATGTVECGEYTSVVKSGDFYAYIMQGRCPTVVALILQ